MKYVQIPDVKQPVSRLVLGGAGSRFSTCTDVSDLIGAALEHGINAIDTARVYGRSEEAIGRWLAHGGRREDLVIISKGCHPSMAFHRRVSAAAAADDLKRSLDALNTDRIDIYLLHRDDESVPAGEIVDFLNRHYEEGKIGAFGGSNWTAARVSEANDYAARHGLKGFTVSSPHYSLGRQRHDPWGNGCKTITGDKFAADREYYIRTQMPVLAWSSLCNGVFSGKLASGDWNRMQSVFDFNTRWAYGCRDNLERLRRCEKAAADKGAAVAQIALAWLLAGPVCALPVITASSPARIAENAAAADIELSAQEYAWLDLSPV